MGEGLARWMDGVMDGWMEKWMELEGVMNRWSNGRRERWMDGCVDEVMEG